MRIPEGWEFWTSEESSPEAWRVAVEWKQMYERVRADAFVRVRVEPVRVGRDLSFWVLYRIETKERTV